MSDFRINGFEQIKAFYSWVFNNADKKVKAQHISLYLFLINQNNRNNWVEWFKCPYDLGMTGACISNKRTYYNCLSDLKFWGLIEYQKGINEWRSPLIKLAVLNSTSTDTATVPQAEPLLQPLPTPLLHPYNKPITDNLKPITDNMELILKVLKNIPVVTKFLNHKELVRFVNDRSRIIVYDPPTKEEWVKYFTDRGYSSEVAIEAWYRYEADNWHDSNGNVIVNWHKKATTYFRSENKEKKTTGMKLGETDNGWY